MRTDEQEDHEQYFRYLDALRESGATNMFGAAPYLAETFGLEKARARGILARWMETFRERHSGAQAP